MSQRIYIFILAIICLSLYIYERVNMFDIEVSGLNGFLGTIFVAIMMLASLWGLMLSKKRSARFRITHQYMLLMFWVYFISLAYVINHPFSSRVLFVAILLPIVLYKYSLLYSNYVKHDNVMIWGITVVFLFLSFYFIRNYNNNVFYNTETQSNASYVILYLLPFLLCHERKLYRYISILLCILIMMLSLKRGGFIALIFGLIVYFYYQQKINGDKKYNSVALVVVLPVLFSLLYFLVVYINDILLNGMLFDRLNDSLDSGGSGRLDIYRYYLKAIERTTVFNFLFGRGWEGSLRVGSLSLTSHNDLLEVLINFGIIGFILYISFVCSVVRLCRQLIISKHKYASAMAFSLAVFAVNSMVSHIFVYPRYMVVFSLFWGFILSSTSSTAQLKNPRFLRGIE